MRPLFLSLLFCYAPTLYSAACQFKISNPKLTWSGYKFTEKTAVNGSFDNIEFSSSKKPEKGIDELLKTVKFRIDTASINSGLDVRDKKLALYIFGGLKNPGIILGRVKKSDIHHGKAVAEIILNGVRKDIVFTARQKKTALEWTGKIDMLDFSMNQAVQAIHNACKTLHTGKDGKSKTWSEVGLKITANIEKKC